MNFIPYGKQTICNGDIEAVVETLMSDFLTQGPCVTKFENAIAAYCDAKYAVATNNATSALHIACLALGVAPGDLVWTSPNSFLSSANCARFCGADVDFVDICKKTYNISIDELCKKLEVAKQQNKLPKVIIPVHFAGQSCNMAEIKSLSEKYHFKIIEDASHAVGGRYKNNPIGNCEYSDITVFSFHPVKIITTGEGGMALTNDSSLAEKMKLYRCHGMTRDESLMQNESHGPWYYQQLDLGYNYRITDIQSALGLSQLNKLDHFIEKRNQLAQTYYQLLKDLPIILPQISSDCYSAFHLFVVLIDVKETTQNRRQVFDYLRSQHIGVNVHYIPIYSQPYYRNKEYTKCINTEWYYERAITLPLYPTLKESEQEFIAETLKAALN